MAAAARSASPDVRDAATARVPCPHCGGLIHPIAGKCKHCKADLTAYRAARPAAAAPLPALAQPIAAPPPLPHRNGQPPPGAPQAASYAPSYAPTYAPTHGAPHGPIAHAVTLPPAAQPVLPPRPTSRSDGDPRASAWRSWPVVVIVIAVVAIVAAVVLMVWPAGRGRDGKRALQPPPAPERMDTQTPPVTPAPHAAAPSPPRDPWAQPSAPKSDPWAQRSPAAPKADPPQDPTAQADPSADPSGNPSADPSADPSNDDDATGSSDPPAPAGSRGHPAVTANAGSMLALAITARLCRKLVQCKTTDPALQSTCDAIASLPSDPPAGCPAAVRCLRHIDAMGCSSQPDALQLGVLLMQFHDCADAAHC